MLVVLIQSKLRFVPYGGGLETYGFEFCARWLFSPVLYGCGLVLYGCGLGIVLLWTRCGFMPFQRRMDVCLLPLAVV